MLSPFLYTSLVALVTSTAVSAAPGLIVKTSTPNVEFDGLENLRVTTTVINTGDETLKLLNDPRGVLNSFPENTFNITGATGSRPLFNGARVNHHPVTRKTRVLRLLIRFQVLYSPEHAAGLGDPSVFTVLAPGASVDVTHDREWGHVDRF